MKSSHSYEIIVLIKVHLYKTLKSDIHWPLC